MPIKDTVEFLLILGLSFNQLKLCPTARWDTNGITFADQSTIGTSPRGLFVDMNDTVYVANRQFSMIIVWRNKNINPKRYFNDDFDYPNSIFVTRNGNIFIDNGLLHGRVDLYISENEEYVTVMNVSGSCFGLFIDSSNNIYCSISKYHQVVKRSLNNTMMATTIAAGTGFSGDALDELDDPRGIHVDINFDLYVADCGNDRIQLFQLDSTNGITVAGETSLYPTITLSCPSGIALDVDKYLFIADHLNHRIVGSGPNGFRCLIGCYETGSQSHQLYAPFSLSFDSFGNMFVTDEANNRVQKFLFLENSCGKFQLIPMHCDGLLFCFY